MLSTPRTRPWIGWLAGPVTASLWRLLFPRLPGPPRHGRRPTNIEAAVVRVIRQTLQPSLAINALFDCLLNFSVRWNHCMCIGRALTQLPQSFGGTGRQNFDEVGPKVGCGH